MCVNASVCYYYHHHHLLSHKAATTYNIQQAEHFQVCTFTMTSTLLHAKSRYVGGHCIIVSQMNTCRKCVCGLFSRFLIRRRDGRISRRNFYPPENIRLVECNNCTNSTLPTVLDYWRHKFLTEQTEYE